MVHLAASVHRLLGPGAVVLVPVLVLGAQQPGTAAAPAAPTPSTTAAPRSTGPFAADATTTDLREVRDVPTADLGAGRPAGLAWSDTLGGLVIAEERAARTRLRSVTPDGRGIGATTVESAARPGSLALDPRSGAVTFVTTAGRVEGLGADRLRGRHDAVPTQDRGRGPAGAVQGAAYDDTGTLQVLQQGRIHRVGGAVPTTVGTRSGHDLRGLAFREDTGLLYTFDATARELVAVDGAGEVAAYDVSGLDLVDVTALAFGPSADSSDDPSVQSLYVADAGGAGRLGQVVEATLDAPVALAATVPVGFKSLATSAFSPPSPDPSGLVYVPSRDRLVIGDGEVDEMSIFRNVNLFTTTRGGSLTDTGVSQPWSDEPVGVGYNPGNNHLFVSDDDDRAVYEIVAGGDNRWGTGDDTVTSFSTLANGNDDPEGVEYDPVTNSIWTTDGVDAEVFRVQAGGDGRFGTGDDVRSHFDVGRYGAEDPEGIAYDAVRDTLVVLDDNSDRLLELDRTGALLNTVDTSAANMVNAAGVTIAPNTVGSSRGYYVVTRGVDNDSHPTENDGRLYEFTVTMPPIGAPTNQPPAVNAGPDATVVLPAVASLDGTVTDDGLPSPPGAVTTAWSRVSGPGTVAFGNSAAVDTTATFSVAGSYVLQLSATDGALTATDQVAVTVLAAGGGSSGSFEKRVAAGSDDAEQRLTGSTSLSSSDLELTTDGTTQQVVGMRFTNVAVPRGATVTNAYLQFQVDEVSTGAASLTVRAENSDNAPTYAATSGNVTSRATTAASVAWSPPDWPTKGAAGAGQRTPNLAALVQAVVSRSGWSAGNALALQVSGTGRRTAEAFEGGASTATLLHVDYTSGTGTPANAAPAVNAGPDATVVLPAVASLDGTVTDDGLPSPPGAVTTAWSRVSGPGTVAFGNSAAVDTTATFSVAGSYVLQLSATDGALTATDQVAVTVLAAGGGSSGSFEKRVAAGSDDAEQRLTGSTSLSSSDLELTTDGTTQQVVGMRFTNVAVPRGATVTNAYLQFQVDEVSTGAASLTVRAENSDNAPTYAATSGNVTSRATTAASVAWSPPDWPTKGAAGAGQRTPNLAALVQAVVSRSGWSAGNALALQVSGTGRRTAEAFEGGASTATLLHVDYTAP